MTTDVPPADPTASLIGRARAAFHAALVVGRVLTIDDQDSIRLADNRNDISRDLGRAVIEALRGGVGEVRLKSQTAGKNLEDALRDFLNEVLPGMSALMPWSYSAHRNRSIFGFAQYGHLKVLSDLAKKDREVRKAIGGDYLVKPDVVVARAPMSDAELNASGPIADSGPATDATLRRPELPILHASLSCKMTIRSDRSQNSRLEALNLIRNRRGRTPHIMVVTGEPMPSRIASIAVGTGDFDCIYHIALPELREALETLCEGISRDERPVPKLTSRQSSRLEQLRTLDILMESHRLKDIADLPIDLML